MSRRASHREPAEASSGVGPGWGLRRPGQAPARAAVPLGAVTQSRLALQPAATCKGPRCASGRSRGWRCSRPRTAQLPVALQPAANHLCCFPVGGELQSKASAVAVAAACSAVAVAVQWQRQCSGSGSAVTRQCSGSGSGSAVVVALPWWRLGAARECACNPTLNKLPAAQLSAAPSVRRPSRRRAAVLRAC